MRQSKCHKLVPAIALFLLNLMAAHCASASTAPLLPVLNWQQRSDWVNVKTGVLPGAFGDGIHDDTAAIQAALNRLDERFVSGVKTVYFPPGTYRITKTLSLTRRQGVALIGHGRTTRIVWDGPLNQTMFLSNGVTWCRYVGLAWDGANKAAVGVDHASKTYYETRIHYENDAFLNFRSVGIRVGNNQVVPTSDIMFRNCLFQNCNNGIAFLQWNDFDNDVEGCDFRDCGIAVNCNLGNVYIRDSHFERSRLEDISLCPHCHSIRRCTSVGSRQFISVAAPAAFANQVTVQDCHVDGWTGNRGAMEFGMRGPTTIFDCSFTHGPDTLAPVRLINGDSWAQQVIVSNNAAPGATAVVDPGLNSNIAQIPAGTRGPSLSDPAQSLFISSVPVPTAVLDVKTQFGAKGDSVTDDTAAITAAVRAAARQGGNALVYLPPGEYNVSSPILLTGGGYSVEGSGIMTVVKWSGSPSAGPVFSVQDPHDISLKEMEIRAPVSVACIQQTSISNAPSNMTYDGINVGGSWLGSGTGDGGGENGHVHSTIANRGLECIGLPASATVHLVMYSGSAHFTDCSRATILQEFGSDGVLQVDGGHYEKSGFLGVMCKSNAGNPCDIVVRDNQNLVAANLYTESTQTSLCVSGDGASVGQPGHVTVQGYCNTYDAQFITVNNYEGRVTAAGVMRWHSGGSYAPQVHTIAQTGNRPVDVVVLGGLFFVNELTTHVDLGAKLMIVQNPVAADATNSFTHNVPNFLTGFGAPAVAALLQGGAPAASVPGGSEALADAAAALDDYRQLGAVDMAINHP